MHPVQETAILLRHELRRATRGVRSLVLLGLYAFATGAGCLLFIAVIKMTKATMGLGGADACVSPETSHNIFQLVCKGDPSMVDYLGSIHVLILFAFWLSLFTLPLLASLMGFDMISGELQYRSLRYFTTRARRGSIFAAKIAAQILLLVGITIAVNLVVYGLAACLLPRFATLHNFKTILCFWALTVPYAAAYIGLAAFISSLFRTVILSLLLSVFALFSLWLASVVLTLVKLANPDAWMPAYLQCLLPSHYQTGLFSPRAGDLVLSVGAYLAFATIFSLSAWMALRRRDI